jgi:hypothetical protein
MRRVLSPSKGLELAPRHRDMPVRTRQAADSRLRRVAAQQRRAHWLRSDSEPILDGERPESVRQGGVCA